MTFFNDQVPGIHRKDSLDYSAVYQIKPTKDADGNYVLLENHRFGPEKPEWKYIAKDTISFYAPFVSGAQRMKNGDTFITEGPKGRIFEVTPEGEIVWEYLNPYHGDIRYLDGDPRQVQMYPYFVWRAHFVPADHPALKGKDLVPLDPQPEVFKLPPPKEEKKEKTD